LEEDQSGSEETELVCVDTSIWVAAWRQSNADVWSHLRELTIANEAALCGQVWVELIGGFRSEQRRARNVLRLQGYPWLHASREAYELAAEWLARFRGIGAGDAIIAATAHLNACELFTLDRSFDALRAAGLKLLSID
jgi:predicted nucleic acid-binding protein